mmetsp:Transcript_35592/g.118981  ORF Transcript_35592/g.118981 Transcript_35592/m.118981 type:complete len:227 (-) Transcript_35592:69-749(-)
MLRAAHGLISGRLGSTSRNLGSTSGGVGVAEVFPRVRCAGGAVDRSACLRPVAVGLPPPRRAAPAPLPLTLTLGAWDGGYEEGSFDAVVSSYVFDVLPDPARTVRRVRALLAPGGEWINVGPLHWHDPAAGLLRLTLREVRALLEHHGFELRRLRAIRRVPYVGLRPRRGLLRWWRDAAAAGWGGGGWSAGGWLGAASGAGEGGEEDSWHNCVFWVARAPPEPWGG